MRIFGVRGAPHAPGPDAGEWELQLHRASVAAEASREVYEDSRETRDRLVLEAVDAGVSVAKVARWAHLSQARVIQILARPQAS